MLANGVRDFGVEFHVQGGLLSHLWMVYLPVRLLDVKGRCELRDLPRFCVKNAGNHCVCVCACVSLGSLLFSLYFSSISALNILYLGFVFFLKVPIFSGSHATSCPPALPWSKRRIT